MLKKWVLVCLLSITSSLTLVQYTSAISTKVQGIDGYINIKGRGNIFVDKFCNSQSASCSNDGKRCFCKPTLLQHSDYNKKCEFAFGSTLNYIYSKRKANGKIDTDSVEILLSGGIWGKLAKTCNLSSKGIVFKKVKGTKNTYYSNFIKQLYRDDCVKKWNNKQGSENIILPKNVEEVGIELDMDIDNFSTKGVVYNQTFYVIQNNQRHRCTLGQKDNQQLEGTKNNSKDILFLKGSEFNFNPNDNHMDVNKNYCTAPAILMLASIFNSSATNNATKNCTNYTGDDHLVWLQELLDVDEGANLDISKATANLIVPMGETRTAYFLKPTNFFYGKIFSPSTKNKREELVKAIRKTYKKECQDKNKINFNCNDEVTFSYIADELEKKWDQSYKSILANSIIESEDSAAKVCDLIDGSWDNVYEIEKTSDQKNKILDIFKKISTKFKNLSRESNNKEEQKINDSINNSVLYFCNSSFPNNKEKRILCKKRTSNCYNLAMTEAKPIRSCEDIAQDKNLKTAKWLICPPVNTSLRIYQKVINKILSFLKTPIDFSQQDKFQQTLKKFIMIANIILLIMFLVMIFSQITNFGLSNYQIKIFLPKFILMVILVNLSLLICQLALDVSNLAGVGIMNNIDNLINEIVSGNSINPNNQHIIESVFGFNSNGFITIVMIIILIIPFIILGLTGLIIGYFYLAVREGLIVILSILTPIALVFSLSPKTKKVYDLWHQNFVKLLLIYPISVLYVKTAQLSRVIISYIVSDSDSNAMMNSISGFLPAISLLLLPFTINKITKSLINITSVSNFTKKQTQKLNKTYFSKAYKQNLQDATTGKLLQKRFIKKTLSNKKINKLTFGSAGNILNKKNIKENSFNKDYNNLIGKDFNLLKAFVLEGNIKGGLYNSLNNSQKERYNRLLALGAHKDGNFYKNVASMMVDNKVYDDQVIKTAGIKAIKNGLDPNTFASSLFVANKLATKKGLSAIAGSFSVAKSEFNNETFNTKSINISLNNNKHAINTMDIERFNYVLDDDSIKLVNAIKNNQLENYNDKEVDEAINFISTKLPVIKETIKSLDKTYPENISIKDFNLEHNFDNSKYTSILEAAIAYKLSEDLNLKAFDKNTNLELKSITSNSNVKYDFSKTHYINKIARSWNYINPDVKEKLEPLILDFAEQQGIFVSKNKRAEDVFKILNIEIKEIKT